MADPGYLSNAELAAQVQALVELVRTFKDQQVNVFSTDENFASVTDGEGNAHVVPSWAAVQSAGSEAGANADLAGASIYARAAVSADAATLQIDTSSGASYIDVTLTLATVELTLPAPEIESGHIKQLTLALAQGTGANRVTWPSNLAWPNGRIPVLSYTEGQVDLVTLLYIGNGNWRGFFAAGGF